MIDITLNIKYVSDFGLVGDVIVGHILAGNQLTISNENNNFLLDATGAYLNNATLTISKTGGNSKIFLDPDNGLRLRSKAKGLNDLKLCAKGDKKGISLQQPPGEQSPVASGLLDAYNLLWGHSSPQRREISESTLNEGSAFAPPNKRRTWFRANGAWWQAMGAPER